MISKKPKNQRMAGGLRGDAAASWVRERYARPAEWACFGRIISERKIQQRRHGQVEVGRAALHDRAHRDHFGTKPFRDANDLSCRLSRRHDVLDDCYTLTRSESETTAQHRRAGFFFDEDVAHAERFGDDIA